MLYFIFHWISSVYETCGVSLFFIFSSTIFNNNIMKSKPKKSLRKIFRQFLCRLIVTCEAMFELSCNIATTMTGLNFKSRIQIKAVFLVGHLKWQIVQVCQAVHFNPSLKLKTWVSNPDKLNYGIFVISKCQLKKHRRVQLRPQKN